jgi:chemotaxis protein methyltransferase CheR
MLAGLQKLRATPPLTSTAPSPVTGGVSAAQTSVPVQRLLAVLREFAGFRSTPHLQRKLEKVFRDMGPDQLSRWVDSLLADPSRRELIALVEDLTNHETYFFRDTPQLDILEKHVLPELVQRKLKTGEKTIRIWSAACATGEEPWTLTLMVLQALLNAGVAREVRAGDVWLPPEWRLEVLGTDISRQAIRVAQAAAYRTEALASFRQFPASYLRFFDDVPAAGPGQPAWRHVRESLHRHVRFDLFNLVSTDPPRRQQDLVLCRNVLIYIDTQVHDRVQRMLASALQPGGHLMLGVVDCLQARDLFNERWLSRCVIHERK